MTSVAIIGGGAAGMMCAATLIEEWYHGDIMLFDKNPWLGAKVIISGGGRCNVTTGITSIKELKKHYVRGADFLDTSLRACTPKGIYKRFEAHGVPLKMEKDMRVFPQSNDGKDIVRIFEKVFAQADNVKILLSESVISIEHSLQPPSSLWRSQGEITHQFIITTDKGEYTVDAVVLTTGGNAYRHTGSTGDGYAFAQALGHSITTLWPSLNSFLVAEEWCKILSGLSFPRARLVCDRITALPDPDFLVWPFLFTHFGISGPVTFRLSSMIPYEAMTAEQSVTIRCVIDADRPSHARSQMITTAVQSSPKKSLKNILSTLLPERFVVELLAYCQIDVLLSGAQLSKAMRESLIDALGKGMVLTLIQRRPGDEFVTAGGVSTDEIDPETMESRICPWLYFAGEIMDIDGVTGGYNLTSSWATGRLAGRSVG